MTAEHPEHRAIARQVIAENRYLTLATADADGVPWATPVFYAAPGPSTFCWASAPDTRHSRNIAVRPQVAITIFDSHAPIGRAEGVYISARAESVHPSEQDLALQLLNDRLPPRQHLTTDDLEPAGPLRMYRATALEVSILIRGGSAASDRATDSRAVVPVE